MTRNDLIAALHAYAPSDEETGHVARVIELLRTKPDCFYRTCFDPGHITGSALLVSADNSQVLMNHHGALNKWICFGGHADGEENIFEVARRELLEESGIAEFEPVLPGIFDVDVHDIPANSKKGEPAHGHYDIRYLFRATGPVSAVASAESHDIRWCDYDEAMRLAGDGSMRRLLRKWRKIAARGRRAA